jgi:hypothetical protein
MLVTVTEALALFSAYVFFFAVFATVDFAFFVGEDEDLVEFLFYGADTTRVLAANYIFDLFWQRELSFFNYNVIFNYVAGYVVIDKTEDI